MKTILSLSLLISFFSIPITSIAIEIQDGYWVGIQIANNSKFVSFEEWHFEKNRLSFQKYQLDSKIPKVFGFGFGSVFQIEDNKLSIKNDEGNEMYHFPISFKGETLLIEYEEAELTVLLYYNGLEKSSPSKSPLASSLTTHLFSIDQARLFFNLKEVEFWNSASFYDENGLIRYHRKYQFIRFGKYDFIYLESLNPIRIIRQENEDFVIEKIAKDGLEDINLKAIKNLNTLQKEDLIGSWKWKETKNKPKTEKNVYTISIGYDIHQLIIDDYLNIQWLTKMDQIIVIENDFESLPSGIIDFQSFGFRRRKPKEIPTIKLSPSGRLIILEMYPIKNNGKPKAVFHTSIQLFEYLEKSKTKIVFKVPSSRSSDKYIVLTKK